ncbi:efflux RND transporter periplasmic adaptor subunit [Paludibaculum fermentans]|uniref:Efflux RND transporter periplasmic adaptor subunit n=1 Tax=Paludibaculum fermentans TaxID=1473598 RepID=A0A7S7NLS1_PALFE|nr:efflux RND transporter periplasmic adaptor subunit [Paludibaculum fermentans]
MKSKWKWIIGVGAVLVVGGGTIASVKMSQRGIVSVQTGKAAKQDLTSLVTASGEIKPKNYVNIGANVMGRIVDINVKEGDRVHRDQVLARLEAVQAQADVQAQQAGLNSALADSSASEAGLKAMDENLRTSQAGIDRSKSELERARLDYERARQLFNEKLVAKQEFDSKKAAYDSAAATLRESEAKLSQMKAQREQTAAQLSGSQRRVTQSRATLSRFSDVLQKHNAVTPIDGIVTNLPVRVGETVVPGVQNSAASLIMTIADMSLITAEVKVDETDIVNVKLEQLADVTIDAIPNQTFKGHVIEIGNTAILRSTGLAASQSAVSSQEAKDFKVVIALDNPPTEIRPGLSCTAKVITATRQKALAIPIQALTVRQRGDLEPEAKPGNVQAATNADPDKQKKMKEELQGVFVVKNGAAEFREVKTGITGATDIEVLSGLKDGEEIITGSYKIIRTLRNQAKVKVDNKAPVKADT